jgi:hypothetical protein
LWTQQLNQTPSGLGGTVSVTNSPCLANGDVTGSIAGDELTLTISAGAIDVSAEGTITGNSMSGTYVALSAGACTGDTGTFSATR